jgi:hypothetical protein
MAEQERERWYAADPLSGKMVQVDPEGEFIEGEIIVRLFYCRAANRFVSIPGASRLRVGCLGEFIELKD